MEHQRHFSAERAIFVRWIFERARESLACKQHATLSSRGHGTPTRGTTTDGTSRRPSRATARSWDSVGPNLKRSFRDRNSGREEGRGRERGPPSGVGRTAKSRLVAGARYDSLRDLGRATFHGNGTNAALHISHRPAHTYLRVPSIARIVQNHAPTIAGPQCTTVACENCGWGKRVFRAITRPARPIRPSVQRRDGYYRVRRARTGRGHNFAHFASRRDISRAYAGED